MHDVFSFNASAPVDPGATDASQFSTRPYHPDFAPGYNRYPGFVPRRRRSEAVIHFSPGGIQ
jgi:hypothetical protein